MMSIRHEPPTSLFACTGAIYCFGILFITRHTIRHFLRRYQTSVIFVESAAEAIKKGFKSTDNILAWGGRGKVEANKLSNWMKVPVWTIEDGFLRSKGLGSDFNRPSSLVIDKKGIYYDPNHPSDLEEILSTHHFTPDDKEIGEKIRQQLTTNKLSKYNFSYSNKLPQIPSDKKTILVPGQVEDDASIMTGCIDVSSNIELLKTVRTDNPSAYIIYKPHPDVTSGNRNGCHPTKLLKKYCDVIVTDLNITDCILAVDEIHTMTSLVGLEGLIIGQCSVHCYGIPFYSNWGLTSDRHIISRRNRLLTIEDMVFAAYYLYPIYFDWIQNEYVDVFTIIEQINNQKSKADSSNLMIPKSPKYLNIAIGLVRSIYQEIKSKKAW